jgi:hypothetical protein
MKFVPLKKFPFEAFVWITGIFFLLLIDPAEQHFSLCPLHHLGWSFCPGCGLGKSISYLLRGELQQSLQTHPLGLFGLAILSMRIFQLLKLNQQLYGTDH